jgi:hypothetical protein
MRNFFHNLALGSFGATHLMNDDPAPTIAIGNFDYFDEV